MIQNAEREYSSAELPLEPTKAEMMLREHEVSRSKVKNLLDSTADEGEEIVVRVRQQVSSYLSAQVMSCNHQVLPKTLRSKGRAFNK